MQAPAHAQSLEPGTKKALYTHRVHGGSLCLGMNAGQPFWSGVRPVFEAPYTQTHGVFEQVLTGGVSHAHCGRAVNSLADYSAAGALQAGGREVRGRELRRPGRRRQRSMRRRHSADLLRRGADLAGLGRHSLDVRARPGPMLPQSHVQLPCHHATACNTGVYEGLFDCDCLPAGAPCNRTSMQGGLGVQC